MMTLTQPETRIVQLFQQLPVKSQRNVLLSLAASLHSDRETRMQYAEAQLRRRCLERGVDWDRLNEDERERFIDDLLHEA